MTVTIAALVKAREVLGWSHKTADFTGGTLAEFFEEVTSETGKTLYDLFVQEDGIIGPDYMILVNRRRVMPKHGLEISLQSGDRIIAMSDIKSARGG